MINGRLFFCLISFLMITDVLAMEKDNENDDDSESSLIDPLLKGGYGCTPPPVLADNAKKAADKKNPKSHDKSFAWYAPTACAAGLLLNNQVSFKIAPACIGLLIGIGGGLAGQYYLDKSHRQEKETIVDTDQSRNETTRNFWIGASLKSIGWISAAVACNGFVNYVMKVPVFSNSVQALDKLVITPSFSNTTPELAQLFQHNHIAAAGIVLAGVGFISNYFLTKPSHKPKRL